MARRGIYAASELSELTPERIQQFFVRIDDVHFQVNKQLRAAIVVARQNLISDAPFSKVDFVSCRNLMIYLEPDLQQKIISLFHFALNENGYLLLGCSESIGRRSDLFESFSKKWRIFRRVGPVRPEPAKIPILTKEDHPFHSARLDYNPRRRIGNTELWRIHFRNTVGRLNDYNAG